MPNTPRFQKFLKRAGSESWSAIGAEFFWGTIGLKQLSANGHQFVEVA